MIPAGRQEENSAPPNGDTPRPLPSLATPRETFRELLNRGCWPVVTYPREEVGGVVREDGKRPIGNAWGLNRWTHSQGDEKYRRFPGAGAGLCLGPSRGPGGKWLADIEGDGSEAEQSRAKLFDGEVIDTITWDAVRGGHQLVTLDEDVLLPILSQLAGYETKKAGQPGVYHLPQLPGLELRLGGYKQDGSVKQLQSVVPPTGGADDNGHIIARRWTGGETIAAAPPAFYATLRRIADEVKASPASNGDGGVFHVKAGADPVAKYLRKILARACGAVAIATKPGRHDELMKEATLCGGYLHYGHPAFAEQEVEDRLTDAADRAAPERKHDNRRCVREAIAYGKAKPLWLPDELHRIASGAGVKPHETNGHTAAAGPGSHSPTDTNHKIRNPSGKTRVCARARDTYRPFPTRWLPGAAWAFVTETAAAMGCDTALVALPVLATLGGLLGNKVGVKLKAGWYEPPVLWAVAVGPSGSVKSPAWQAAVAPVHKLQSDLFEQYRQKAEVYEAELADWKRRSADGNAGPKPAQPVCQRLVVSDITVEKLAVVLGENPTGVLLARDEVSGWVKSFDQYKSRGGADLANWLEMHRAGPVVVDRKNGGTVHVRRAAVSVCGTVQPGTLARLMTREARQAGLAARLLLTWPPARKKKWTEAEVDPATVAAYGALVRNLHGRACPSDPVVVPLSPAAKVVFVRFFNWLNRIAAHVTGDVAAAYAKLEAVAARLALIHHCATADEPWSLEVSGRSMRAGVRLAMWFAKEARRIYGLLADVESDADRDDLLEFIRRKGGRVKPRDLMNWRRRLYPTAHAADLALMAFEDRGHWETETPPGGGRTETFFVLND
jgi:Protein of unknown function (DUF3987)